MAYGQGPRGKRGYGKGQFSAPEQAAAGVLGDPRQAGGAPGEEGGGPYFVFGRKASDLEWFTYRSLRRLGWRDRDIEFQTAVLGGHLPGGALLDFVIWAPFGPAIVEPRGGYWHRNSLQQVQKDKAREALIASVWRRPFRYRALGEEAFVDEATTDRVIEEFVGRG